MVDEVVRDRGGQRLDQIEAAAFADLADAGDDLGVVDRVPEPVGARARVVSDERDVEDEGCPARCSSSRAPWYPRSSSPCTSITTSLTGLPARERVEGV